MAMQREGRVLLLACLGPPYTEDLVLSGEEGSIPKSERDMHELLGKKVA